MPAVPPTVDRVEIGHVVLFDEANPLRLRSGELLTHVEVAYETYGRLDADAGNAVFICHALTGDAHAAGVHDPDDPKSVGWWDNLIGPGKPLDTDQLFVICPNLLGGCQGTTGPSSTNPATGEAYGLDFPLLQMADIVAVHRALVRHLGIERLLATVGGSLGGMQVLQWATEAPDEVGHPLVIAASSRLTAQNIAFSAVARAAIMQDPGFAEGRYLAEGSTPTMGLSIARMMAHITYLSEQAMDEKFGRRFQQTESRGGFGVDFAVESYLAHQGVSFLGRFDALSYLYLTRAMDYFDPFDDPEAVQRLRTAGTHFLLISFDSDWRFSTAHSRRVVRILTDGRVPVSFREISSPWGHDSFLLELPDYHRTVRAFIEHAGDQVFPHAGRAIAEPGRSPSPVDAGSKERDEA